MIDKKDCFYIGSCRYMKFFPHHFPAKLHTTKEIINYLNNYNSIDLDMENVNYVYGDILQPDCMEEVLDYCQNANSIFDKVNNIFMEITSRKYVLQGGGWYSNYYFNPNNDKDVSIVNDDELYSDLLHIKYLIGDLFNIDNIFVIPHMDLLLKNGKKINGRHELIMSLKNICDEIDIGFVNINEAFPKNSYYDDIAPDTLHYSKIGYFKVFRYLQKYLENRR